MFLSWAWLRDVRLLVLLAGVSVIGAVTAGSDQGQHTCSATDPCLPSAFGSTTLGLLLASMVAAYLHRSATAWLAIGTAAAFVMADLLDPTMPWWVYLVVLGYVAVCWCLPGTVRQSAGSAVAGAVPVTDHRPVPRPARVPVLGRHWLAVAVVLAVTTVALVWWGIAEQDRKDAQQRAARIVTGVVREQRDGSTVRVEVPGGRRVDVDVLDATDYPVGSQFTLYQDGEGLSQPVSEPYDATGWLALAAFTGAVTLAGTLRTVDRNAALRRLFAEAQPVRAVRAVEDWSDVYLHLPGTGPGRMTVVAVPVVFAGPPEGAPSWPDDEDHYDDEVWPDEDEEDTAPGSGHEPVLAVLYGDPRPGHWCAVQVDGRIRLPRSPVRFVEDIPVDLVTGEHSAVADEPPVDPALLADADRYASPGDLRVHRPHPLIRWTRALAAPALLVLSAGKIIGGPLGPQSHLEEALAAATLTAAGLYYGWRRHLRPYLCWNAGGLVAVTMWRVITLTWSARTQVDQVGAEVRVFDDEGEEAITAWARPRMRLLPAAPGERTAEQLGNAMRAACGQAVVGGGLVRPPVVDAPKPPLGVLLGCWVVLAPTATVALHWAAR